MCSVWMAPASARHCSVDGMELCWTFVNKCLLTYYLVNKGLHIMLTNSCVLTYLACQQMLNCL